MTKQNEMFDSMKSIREARNGKLVAAANRSEMLIHFQTMARELARKNINRECDSNALAQYAWKTSQLDISKILGNASGSIFKGNEWAFTGRWTKSERIRSHGRDVKVWRLREGR
jgi:hypothetical protein